MDFSSANRRTRAAIRLDCTGDPPGEFTTSATAAGFIRNAFSMIAASPASFNALRPPPIVPASRITGTTGDFFTKGINFIMPQS